MEIEGPIHSPESVDDNPEQQGELIGDELRHELGIEAGSLVVNPLANDVDFSAVNDDEDVDE